MFKLILLCDYSREPERRLLRGLFDFARTCGGWSYFTVPDVTWRNSARSGDIINMARTLKADAIFGWWEGMDEKAALSLGIPIITRAGSKDRPNLPMLRGKYREIGAMAADFFIRQHYSSYAFIGYKNTIWSDERMEGFAGRIASDGVQDFSFFKTDNKHDEWPEIMEWLRGLPKPVALFAAHDALAVTVCQLCQEMDIHIPGEVALLGVDNDEFLCNISYPAISSINLNFEKQGYELGHTIWRMHEEGRMWPERLEVEPVGIVERGSTKKHNISDPYIHRIVDEIDSRFTSAVTLQDLTADIPLSRRVIEKRFKAEMAPDTMLSYLTRLRVEHMCHLLKTSGVSIMKAAEDSGFADALNVGRIFKKYTGLTPGEYRKKYTNNL